MRIFFSVGEPSGDQHAAHLIHALKQQRSDIQASGFGGPEMAAAGCRIDYQLTDLAVMGFLRVLPMLGKFHAVYRLAKSIFQKMPPDVVVLVDFPGFNWWIARAAKRAGIPVIYYMPPQLWAWAPWRIRRVRRNVDQVLCALPFERDWFAERGVDVEFVGHPFFDEVADAKLDHGFIDQWNDGTPNIGILPGSRNHEIERNWPIMLRVIENLHARGDHVRFLVACYNDEQRQTCEAAIARSSAELPIQCFTGKTSEIIEVADFCHMVSGSVSLELLARTTPGVVLYRLDRLLHVCCKLLVMCDFISLPNLMAKEEVMPEFVSSGNPQAKIENIAGVLNTWLINPRERQRRVTQMARLNDEYGLTGATGRAATAILKYGPEKVPRRRAA